jgi:tRNA dimethylallyltransferase
VKLAILGPTASGKSALAVELARRTGGTVVNGDPFQAVRGLAIGTGQPCEAEQAGVPHVGYGVLPLAELPNPASFGIRVRQWLAGAPRPVLVTGSGLYLRGIWDQLDPLPEVPERIVAAVRRWDARFGTPALHRRLARLDPDRAAALHPNDRARVQRALALFLATGRRPSTLLTGVPKGLPGGWKALLVLPEREAQRQRVARRVQAMVAQGWAEEVRTLVAQGQEEALRRLKPLGYLPWLDSPDDPVRRIVQETQAYAKRQGTWFRNQLPGVPTWDPDRETLETAWGKLQGQP